MNHVAYLSLGSNLGDRKAHLLEAIGRLRQVGTFVSLSSFYETEPVEFIDQAWFLNCAVGLETNLGARQFMQELLRIEQAMGRERVVKKGPRTIDIDLLLFDDEIIQSPELTVPHPAMHERRFVLEPLAQIAPDVQHPVLKKTVSELLRNLPSGQTVRKL
jgi:2-amino-4-hydroxy-6-hydroxymethyldihydropteridine diphosphokinase